tara:strand:- start:22 stop:405 length:384 start_codon:yes stop_codon:yes gene_type:complete
MSTSQPYYWKSRKAWYLMIKSPNGKRSQVKLGDSRKEAFEKFGRIKDSRSLANPLAMSLMDEWLGKLAVEMESGLISKSRFENLARSTPTILVENPSYTWKDINPETVLAWTAGKGWSPDTAGTRIG